MNTVATQIGLSWRGSLIRQMEEEPDSDILPYPYTFHKSQWASVILDRDTGNHDLLGPVGGWREDLTADQVDAQLQAWGISSTSGWADYTIKKENRMDQGCTLCTPEALCPEGQRLLQRKIHAAQNYNHACYSGPGGSKVGSTPATWGSFDMMMSAARAYERHRTPNS